MRRQTKLFLLCWIAYFSTYIGRQNYAAVMAEIIASEGFLNRTCGLIGTAFFISYGIGQLISGFLGDRFNPRLLIFYGLFLASLSNLFMGFSTSSKAMIVIWCINGAAQSLTWSPLLRIFSEYLSGDDQRNAFVNIATTYPAAVFLIYPLSAFLVYVFNWRMVFFLCGGFMLAVSLLWLFGFKRIEQTFQAERARNVAGASKSLSHANVLPLPFTRQLIYLLVLLGFLLTIQGALRDGVTNWVPSYLSNTYQVGTSVAIFATTALPFVNLFGVYIANFIYKKGNKNEVETTGILFVIALIAICLLILTEGYALIFSLLFFAIITSCMMGINVMLVNFIPARFIRFGRVSTMSGILNATVYIGSSLAAYGLGAVADLAGWSLILKSLCFISLVGIIGSLACNHRWKRFLKEL